MLWYSVSGKEIYVFNGDNH